MLQDRFDRTHTYLRISLSEHCNFRCSYCVPGNDNGDDEPPALLPVLDRSAAARSTSRSLSQHELLRLARIFVSEGVSKIRLTGGEPLIRSEFAEIVEELSLLPVELCLSTNAALVHRHRELMRRVGLRSVNVSLDSMHPPRFHQLTGVNALDVVKENILGLLEDGAQVKVNMVVLRDTNDDEVPDFVEWTRHHNLDVRFIEFMPFPSNHWQESKLIHSAVLLERIRMRFPDVLKIDDAAHDTSRSYRVPGFAGRFGFISTMSEPFCSDCNRLRLSADGKLRTCLFASDETDLATLLRSSDYSDEDVRNRIREAVMGKADKLGGHHSAQWAIERTHAAERPMISIGG